MATDNPYVPSESASDSATSDHRTLLAQTQPWLILIGVITALGAALFGLGTLFVGLASGVGLLAGSQSSEFAEFGMAGGAMMLVMTAFYGGFAVLYGAFAWFLIKQGMAIARYRGSGASDDLTMVLRAHRDFWRLAGITTLVLLVLYCATFTFFMSAGAALQQVFENAVP